MLMDLKTPKKWLLPEGGTLWIKNSGPVIARVIPKISVQILNGSQKIQEHYRKFFQYEYAIYLTILSQVYLNIILSFQILHTD